MDITIYTLPDCPECEAVRAALAAKNMRYVEVDLNDLVAGAVVDPDAMAEAVLQNMTAPLVKLNDTFTTRAALVQALADFDGRAG